MSLKAELTPPGTADAAFEKAENDLFGLIVTAPEALLDTNAKSLNGV